MNFDFSEWQRHLRSEGGAECRKIQKEVGHSDDMDSSESQSGSTPNLKPDPDGNSWALTGGIVM